MVDLVARFDGKVFIPSTRFDTDACEAIRSRRDGRLSFTFARSIQLQRWYRGFVARVAEAKDFSPGLLHSDLKFQYGFIDGVFSSPRFGVAVSLRSSRFDEMDDTEFLPFVKWAVEYCFKELLPGVRRADVYRAVEEWVGPRPW
jgi:hypothetical protein